MVKSKDDNTIKLGSAAEDLFIDILLTNKMMFNMIYLCSLY